MWRIWSTNFINGDSFCSKMTEKNPTSDKSIIYLNDTYFDTFCILFLSAFKITIFYFIVAVNKRCIWKAWNFYSIVQRENDLTNTHKRELCWSWLLICWWKFRFCRTKRKSLYFRHGTGIVEKMSAWVLTIVIVNLAQDISCFLMSSDHSYWK